MVKAQETITVTPTASGDQTTFKWDKVPSAAKYRVAIDNAPLNNPTTNIFIWTLAPGNHTFSVTALDSVGKELATSGTLTVNKTADGVEIVNPNSASPAASTTTVAGINLPNSKFSSLEDLSHGAANYLLGFAGALATIAVVYSGIMYMTAANTVAAKGDVGKVEKAKKNLTWAIMGIVIVILALVIVNEIPKILGG